MKDKLRLGQIDYLCGRCGAKPGAHCKTSAGDRALQFHKSRLSQVHAVRMADPNHHWGPEPGELLSDGHTRRDERVMVPPQLPDVWRAAFLKSTLRTGFCLALSQPMLEQLCAVAEKVESDRSVFRHSLGLMMPDNPATLGSLERRGLVRHRGEQVLRDERDARSPETTHRRWHDNICDVWELTPAGEQVVRLLRLTGVFIEPSAAIDLRARRAGS